MSKSSCYLEQASGFQLKSADSSPTSTTDKPPGWNSFRMGKLLIRIQLKLDNKCPVINSPALVMWCMWKASWPARIFQKHYSSFLSQFEFYGICCNGTNVTCVSNSWPSSVGWMLISYSCGINFIEKFKSIFCQIYKNFHFQINSVFLKSSNWKPCSLQSGSQSHWDLWVESWQGSRLRSSSLDGWSFQSNRLLPIPSEKISHHKLSSILTWWCWGQSVIL